VKNENNSTKYSYPRACHEFAHSGLWAWEIIRPNIYANSNGNSNTHLNSNPYTYSYRDLTSDTDRH